MVIDMKPKDKMPSHIPVQTTTLAFSRGKLNKDFTFVWSFLRGAKWVILKGGQPIKEFDGGDYFAAKKFYEELT